MAVGQTHMNVAKLEQEQVTAYYEPERRVAYILYTGVLGSDASSAAYQWLAELIAEIGIENIYGEIFDFTGVTQFQPDNLIDARKNSRKLNLRVDIHSTPVAMIVRDMIQEEILRGPMRNVPENRRKRIVMSEEAAYDFFAEWHAENQAEG
jgi:hypothetical protein